MTTKQDYERVHKLRLFLQIFGHLAWRRTDNLVSKDDLFIALLNTGELSATEISDLFRKAEYNGQIYEVHKGYYMKTQ